MNKTNFTVLIAILLIIAFIAGTQIQKNQFESKPAYFYSTPTPTPTPQENFVGEGETKLIIMDLPAVDKNDQGVLAQLNVEARSGNGRIYIDYSQGAPLLGSETQTSILTAVDAAKKITGKTLQSTNVYYSFSTDAQEVGGSSAGAAATVATAALLSGRSLKKGFIITGSVDEKGSIGPVGRIIEKAMAAKKGGYTTFLVPPGEAQGQVTNENCNQTTVGNAQVTDCNSQTQTKSVQDLVGISVIEVSDVRQAFYLMTQ